MRAETSGVKQDLQDALDLCDQHEELMEERNKELEACDVEIRSVSLSVCVCVSERECVCVCV